MALDEEKLNKRVNGLQQSINEIEEHQKNHRVATLSCIQKTESIEKLINQNINAQKVYQEEVTKTGETLSKLLKGELNSTDSVGEPNAEGGGINKEQFHTLLQDYLSDGVLDNLVKNYISNSDTKPKKSNKKSKGSLSNNTFLKYLLYFTILGGLFFGGQTAYNKYLKENQPIYTIGIKKNTSILIVKTGKITKIQSNYEANNATLEIRNNKKFFQFSVKNRKFLVPFQNVKLIKKEIKE